jgi:hypothetical protein
VVVYCGRFLNSNITNNGGEFCANTPNERTLKCKQKKT